MNIPLAAAFTIAVLATGCAGPDVGQDGAWHVQGSSANLENGTGTHEVQVPADISFIHVKASLKASAATDLHVSRLGGPESCGGTQPANAPLANETLCAFYHPGEPGYPSTWLIGLSSGPESVTDYQFWVEWSTRNLDDLIKERNP